MKEKCYFPIIKKDLEAQLRAVLTHRLDHGLDYCIGILWLLNDSHNLRPYHGAPNQMEGDLIMHRLFTQMETGVVFASVHPLSSIDITLLVTCTCDEVATIKAFCFSKREIYQSITDIIGCYALACESENGTRNGSLCPSEIPGH